MFRFDTFFFAQFLFQINLAQFRLEILSRRENQKKKSENKLSIVILLCKIGLVGPNYCNALPSLPRAQKNDEPIQQLHPKECHEVNKHPHGSKIWSDELTKNKEPVHEWTFMKNTTLSYLEWASFGRLVRPTESHDGVEGRGTTGRKRKSLPVFDSTDNVVVFYSL